MNTDISPSKEACMSFLGSFACGRRPILRNRWLRVVSDVASKVVDRFTIVSEAVLRLPVEDSNDRVHNYSRVLCHVASLAMEFTDAWSEGDGVRVLRCWKVLLLHFFAGRRTKYALEALRIQVHSLPRLGSPTDLREYTWR